MPFGIAGTSVAVNVRCRRSERRMLEMVLPDEATMPSHLESLNADEPWSGMRSTIRWVDSVVVGVNDTAGE
jgi:hypothetical protein